REPGRAGAVRPRAHLPIRRAPAGTTTPPPVQPRRGTVGSGAASWRCSAVVGPPDDQRTGRRRPAQPGAGLGGDDVTAGCRGEDPRPLPGEAEQLLQPVAEPLVLLDELEDPGDPGEVDTLLLGEPLDLAELVDVALGVAAPAARRALRHDQAQPVVRAQGLGVHAGP